MKIVFFGTPDFAVASLEAINQSNHEIVSVVTSVDKPAGRGKLQSSSVKNMQKNTTYCFINQKT